MDDLARIKQGMKWMWSLGDYPPLAERLQPGADVLATRCGIDRGARVLDVAAGNGNFALAAARRGAVVTAVDLSPRMVELGRERTGRAGLEVGQEGDAEHLAFEGGAFDIVASTFGAMFAPRPDLVVTELARVTRPDGTVAMANYAADGILALVVRAARRVRG